MTHERTKELQSSNALSVLCSINTDLKFRSRTEVSKQDPDSIVPRLPSHPANIPPPLPVPAIPATHRNNSPCPIRPLPVSKQVQMSHSTLYTPFFALLWKAPAPLLLPELEGMGMMGIWGCLCPPNTALPRQNSPHAAHPSVQLLGNMSEARTK